MCEVGGYGEGLLGSLILLVAFVGILVAIYGDMKKRPVYWRRLIHRSLPYWLVVGLVLSFVGYFLGRYDQETGNFLLGLGLVALFFLFVTVLAFLVEYIVEYMKRRRKTQ